MKYWFFCLALFAECSIADTVDNYMSIADNIPQMEMKADPQSQAWARSAHHVLTITSESIAETLNHANELAKGQGSAIFCTPPNTALNSTTVNEIIQQTYKSLTGNDRDKMTVSQVALIGVTKQFPCQASNKGMAHLGSLLTTN